MKNRKFLTSVGILIVVIAILFAIRRFSTEQFTEEKWRSATPEMRDRLLLSLGRSGILSGLTKKNVYEMLGEPDGSSNGRAWYCRRYYGEDGEIKKRFAGISKCLYVSFQNGQVAKVEFTGS